MAVGCKEQIHGEGENTVRFGEGVVAKTRRGRRGEGEKSVRMGQVEVQVPGLGGEGTDGKKAGAKQAEMEVQEGEPRAAGRRQVEVLLMATGRLLGRWKRKLLC